MRVHTTTAAAVVALAALCAATCVDTPPSSDYTCAQQAGWGKCNQTWMASYCLVTCGRCPSSSEDDGSDDSTCVGVDTELNGEVWAAGVNYAQHMWANSWMTDFLDSNWDTKFAAMKTELQAMKAVGARVVRWWIFARGDDYMWPSCWSGDVLQTLPTNYVLHMQQVFNYTYSIGMLVYPSLMSFDWGNGLHTAIFTNSTCQDAWFNNGIGPIIEGLKNNPAVFAWDLCNEPEWMVNATDNGAPSTTVAFRLATAKKFFNRTLNLIKSKGAKQPVSLGSANIKWLTQYTLWNDLNLDFWDFHWYSWATPYFNPMTTLASSIKPTKKVIIGEVQPDVSSDSTLAAGSWCDGGACNTHGKVMKRLKKMGYSGYLPWAWTDSSTNCINYMGTYEKNFLNNCSMSSSDATSTVTPVVVVSSVDSPESQETTTDASSAPIARISAAMILAALAFAL